MSLAAGAGAQRNGARAGAGAQRTRRRPGWRALPALLGVGVVVAVGVALVLLLSTSSPARLAIHVRGNRLVDGAGAPVRLLGVNFSGAEYECVQGRGIWAAPTGAAAIDALVSWHVDVVRIPLNEDCWLAIHGIARAFSGAAYQRAIHAFVAALNARGIYAILDLQWNAPGAQPASSTQVMADADHAPSFWRSVARSFRDDPAVIFDLYNEPHGISWTCWLAGCTVATATGVRWRTAGMQTLVEAVRSTGATQPLMLGGLAYANDLTQWAAHLPADPRGQLVASVHVYPDNPCSTAACWSAELAPVAAAHPIVAGEVGEFDCAAAFVDSFMDWADMHDVSYLGWSWNATGCSSGPALIASAAGIPTPFGQGLQTHLRTPIVTVESAGPTPNAGEPVTITASVTGRTPIGSPRGSVAFAVDGAEVGTAALRPGGVARLRVPSLRGGRHALQALYLGDASFDRAYSAVRTRVVGS